MPSNPSLWIKTSAGMGLPSLNGEVSVDVAIVGGGIAGIACAYQLNEQGFRVAVLDSFQVGSGVTGFTTAKVTSGHRLIYDHLHSQHGAENALAYAQANQWGVEWIAKQAEELGIECDLERRPMLIYAEDDQEEQEARRELDAATAFGLPVTWTETVDLPLKTRGAIRYENQVQFHPTKFVRGLAAKLVQKGGLIFENSKVLEVSDDAPCRLRTQEGTVTARFLVIASHYPIYDPAMYLARLAPYRDYVVAAKLKGPVPQDMSIGVGEESKSFRTQPSPEGELLIVGGEMHKTGDEPDTSTRYARLEEFVRQHFEVESIPYRWSTQDNMTPNRMPYIGSISPKSEHVFVMTGFNAWGMSTGAFGGKVIADLLNAQANPWIKAFDPNRFRGWESVKEVVKENIGAVKHLVGDKFTDVQDRSINDLAPGDAAILKIDGEKVAVHRDAGGSIHAVSPICTHIGCDIAWNVAEATWDCPCHGSRFAIDGTVIQGPAIKDLERKTIATSPNPPNP